MRRIEKGTPEHDRIMDDWHKIDWPRRVVDPEREPANPDRWLTHLKPRGDTAGAPSIPPDEKT